MRAVLFYSYGGPEVLHYTEEAGLPEAGRGQVRVRLVAAGVNPLDVKLRSGALRWFFDRSFPKIPGNDGAGVIDAVGANVEGYFVGDRVYGIFDGNLRPSWKGFAKSGTYSEYAVTRAETLARIPDGLGDIEAAAIPMAATTAFQGLMERGRLTSGERVLLIGASGGVGHFAVQLAAAEGAVVHGICGSEGLKTVLELGAKRAFDYRKLRVEELPGLAEKEGWGGPGKCYDLIFDIAARGSYGQYKQLLKEGGRYVTNVASPRALGEKLWSRVASPVNGGRTADLNWVKPSGQLLERLGGLIGTGKLMPRIGGRFPLEEAAKAMDFCERGRPIGKIVIEL